MSYYFAQRDTEIFANILFFQNFVLQGDQNGDQKLNKEEFVSLMLNLDKPKK